MLASDDRARHATAVGNAITRLHRDHYGRGATTTRTTYQNNHLIVFLEDIYTPVERTLIEAGEAERVRGTRLAFHDAMQDAFKAAVEQVFGRPILGYTSQVLVEEALAVELFVLAPEELSAGE